MMLTASNAIWLKKMSNSLDGQTLPQPDHTYQPVPAYRPCRSHPPHHPGFVIRQAQTLHQHGVADMLVRQMYSWRGYSTESVVHRLNDPNRVTLSAWKGDDVVATLTLGRDSPVGLLADAHYCEELAGLRRPDRIICEVSRLAVDPDCGARDLLTTLFQAGYKYAMNIFAANDAVIEVNPRHARFYQRLLGFRQIGELRQCQRVHAPAVLLHQNLDGIVFPADIPSLEEC